MKTKRGKRGGRSAPRGKTVPPYPFEFRLKVVRLRLDEGYTIGLLSEEFGISQYSVSRWVKLYREQGEDGLKPKVRRSSGRTKLAAGVADKIVELKKSHPTHGPRRISDILKRFFLIRTSPSTVHRTLAAKGMTARAKRKPVKNPPKPRFFERSRPNQLWQSDIMTFRLAGRNAYLIGYIDDYSRYITGMGLYRSQTAAHVIETYRRAAAEYGVPREMLTDNGRQYTNWRGKTRFEREMKKDRIKHIRSRPHHPMTLGKIERFWKSILAEFLQRAQFDSFEQAVARTAFWVKYYNYKRPHQGIGGLCPADRFFEIAFELKKTLERGVEENALELALRGRPVDPFYMVGRMGAQSVVIRAEKGKVKMLVNGEHQDKELVYDARKDIDDEDKIPQDIRSTTENNGRAVDLDREAHFGTALPGDVHQPGASGPVAEPGYRGDDHGPGSQDERTAFAAEPEANAADRKEAGGPGWQDRKAPQDDPEENQVARDDAYGKTSIRSEDRPPASRVDYEGSLQPDDRQRGGPSDGSLSQDVLQVGTTRFVLPAGGIVRSGLGPPGPPGRSPSPGIGNAGPSPATGERTSDEKNGAKGCTDGFEVGTRCEPGEKKMSTSKRRFP